MINEKWLSLQMEDNQIWQHLLALSFPPSHFTSRIYIPVMENVGIISENIGNLKL